MKKTVLLMGLLAGVASTAAAQTPRVGIKAGVGLANVTGSATDGSKNLFVFGAGVMAETSFSSLVSFHPELLYSQKGTKYSFSSSYTYNGLSSSENQAGQIRLSYLDLPLPVRLKAAGAFFEVGPQLGLLLAQKSEATTTTVQSYNTGIPVTTTTTSSSTSTAGTRTFDVGYVIGLGYQLPQGLEVGVRYNGGISDLSSHNSSSDKTRNSVFQFQVGYLFGGK